MKRQLWLSAIAICTALGFASVADARPGSEAPNVCPTDANAPAITPPVFIDAKGGPTIGTMQYLNGGGLKRRQVALTFDDGPDPKTTPRILDILDKHCIKATFFMVGIYAKARPDLVKEVARRGHIIATHSYTHPNNLRHLSLKRAKREITMGIEAISEALASVPNPSSSRVAPFFRFPGLNDSKPLIKWLGEQDIATLSCTFGADDWKRISSNAIYRKGLRMIESEGSGILILHDTKSRTADMLSKFITTLHERGYTFVQLAPKPTPASLAKATPPVPVAIRSALP